jgi:pimeloyl-ACP methyl ester carboxylesterase
MVERSFVTAAGVTLNVATTGGTGPSVVLLHGVTRRWQDWLTVVPHLASRWRVVALDFRGHGRSDRTPGAYRVADYAPDVIDFLRRGLDEPAILIGHSLGGNVAAAVAAGAPERVRAVVLEDPPLEMAGPRLAETYFFEMFRVSQRLAGSNRSLAAVAAELAEARILTPSLADRVRLGDVRDPVSLRVSASGLKRLDPEVLDVPLSGAWLNGSDVAANLHQITCPALLLQAEFTLGGILPEDHATEMAAFLRDGVHIKLPGLGHNIHGTATEAMMRLVVPFLGSLD